MSASSLAPVAARRPPAAGLETVLEEIAAGAADRDAAAPAFPEVPVAALERAGALAATADALAEGRQDHAREWDLVRRVARADGSVGRIVDGHLNGVERVAARAPEPLRSAELDAVRAGSRRIGVWGADPGAGEGPPARIAGGRLEGVKVFCSGAGGVDRALVVARDAAGAARLAYVDARVGVELDRGWFRGSGMRTSESHRVVFRGTPVLAVLGGPGEIAREPWFSRDAMRTAAGWAGIADRAADAALAVMRARDAADEHAAAAAGRILVARATIDRWLEGAAREADDPDRDMRAACVALRAAVADACRVILDEGARAAGSRALATGDAGLDRCRRDLGLMLLQHRLEPMVARLGRAALEGGGR